MHIDGKPMQIPNRGYDPRQGYRLCLDELERHLHPGARRGAPRSETGGGVIGPIRICFNRKHATSHFWREPMSRSIRQQSLVRLRSLPRCLSRAALPMHARRARKKFRFAWTG